MPTVLDGRGQVSHLGRVDLAGDVLELDFLGSLEIDAASGRLTGEGQLQIVGGTGRFLSATGEIDWLITIPVLTGSGGEAPIVGDGWIDYDASDRR